MDVSMKIHMNISEYIYIINMIKMIQICMYMQYIKFVSVYHVSYTAGTWKLYRSSQTEVSILSIMVLSYHYT